jgi:hypothetical protein
VGLWEDEEESKTGSQGGRTPQKGFSLVSRLQIFSEEEHVLICSWKTGSPASRSESYLPEHPPRSDSPPNLVLNNQLRLPHSNATTSLPAGAQAAYSHAVGSPSSPAGPSAYARYLSFISDVGPEEETSPSSQTRPQSPSSTLTRSASLSETTTSGESSWPLLAAARRRRGSLSLQRFRRDSTTTTPRKLQKRRAGSTSTIIHTRPTIHVVPDMSDGDTEIGKEDHIPCTQDAVGMDDEQWALARNSSTSTTTSSMIAPSTEESTVLTPPYPVIDGDGNTHHRWSSIDILNASRSSTASYSSGDDETLPDKTMVEERPTFDLRQMLWMTRRLRRILPLFVRRSCTRTPRMTVPSFRHPQVQSRCPSQHLQLMPKRTRQRLHRLYSVQQSTLPPHPSTLPLSARRVRPHRPSALSLLYLPLAVTGETMGTLGLELARSLRSLSTGRPSIVSLL